MSACHIGCTYSYVRVLKKDVTLKNLKTGQNLPHILHNVILLRHKSLLHTGVLFLIGLTGL